MTRRKTDYSKGLIYRIYCKDPNVKELYVGSTVDFEKRRSCHKNKVNNKNNVEYNSAKSKFIRQHGGWNNWKMELIEYYPSKNITELEKRERFWYDTLSSELNINRPYTSDEEKKNYKKNYDDKRYIAKRDIILKQKRDYDRSHKKEKQLYKEKVGRFKCGCGSTGLNNPSVVLIHEKTIKHQEWLFNQLD